MYDLVAHDFSLSVAQQSGGGFITKPVVFAGSQVRCVHFLILALCPRNRVAHLNTSSVAVTVRNLTGGNRSKCGRLIYLQKTDAVPDETKAMFVKEN